LKKVSESLRNDNRIYFFDRPNPPQTKLLEAWRDPAKKVFTYTGANRIGKTTIGSIIADCVMAGKWLWNNEKIDFPHRKARKVRYVGQAWESHIKATLIPTLTYWWPKNRPLETRKNNQGVDAIWKDLETGSTLEVMSNNQESDMFEGWEGDLVIYDEPPRRDVRIACARGLIDRQGRELFCMTLLKEAWVHREVIKARLANGEPDRSVFNIDGDIYSNVGFGLTKEGVDQFIKTLNPDEIEARIKGRPSYMSSLVCPKFDRDIHVKERFKIPLDALVSVQIDFHPSKKWAISFMATTRSNFKYLCEEIEEHGNPKYIAEEIVRIIKKKDYRVAGIQIDPLAKGDGNNDMTVYEIMAAVFGSYGYTLDVASKDKDNGISLLNDLLMTENAMPALYFFKDCHRTIRGLEDWLYDPETFKPSKVNDDFCEVAYRHVLMDVQWYPEQDLTVKKQPSMML
jgi:hypothetical protein